MKKIYLTPLIFAASLALGTGSAYAASLIEIGEPLSQLYRDDGMRVELGTELDATATDTLQAEINADAATTATTGETVISTEAMMDADAEIRVNRSDIEDGSAEARISIEEVSTPEELRVYAENAIRGDENIEEIVFDDNRVEVSYKQRGEMFGFIPVTMTVKASIDAEGNVMVDYPWYSFAVSKAEKDLESNLSAHAFAALGSSSESATTSVEFTARTQADLVSRIQSVLRENLAASAEVEGEAESEVEMDTATGTELE